MNNKKICLICGKLMLKKDYILYSNYPNRLWEVRKYCSNDCSKLANKNMTKKKWNLNNEHNRKIIESNKIINGKIVGINQKPNGDYGLGNGIIPDILKNNKYYEVEVLGHSTLRKMIPKYSNKDGKKILIISIKDELKNLFDEVYILEDIKNIKHLNIT